MNIPPHPRLGPSKAQAQAYFAAHPFTPSANDAFSEAFNYLSTGNTTSAQNAISLVVAIQNNLTSSQPAINYDKNRGVQTSDPYRHTDYIPYVLDWCYDFWQQTNPAQLASFIAWYTDVVTYWQNRYGATVGMEVGNYYWGYRRNEVLWDIASNAGGPTPFLDKWFGTYWPAVLARFNGGNLAGGVWPEGDEYGRYMAEYSAQIIAACFNCGRDLTQETSFFADSVEAFRLRCSTQPVGVQGSAAKGFSWFPSCDDTDTGNLPGGTGYPDPTVHTLHSPGSYLGDTLLIHASLGNAHARWLLSQIPFSLSRHWVAWDQGGTAVKPTGNLWFAPGLGHLFVRDMV